MAEVVILSLLWFFITQHLPTKHLDHNISDDTFELMYFPPAMQVRDVKCFSMKKETIVL